MIDFVPTREAHPLIDAIFSAIVEIIDQKHEAFRAEIHSTTETRRDRSASGDSDDLETRFAALKEAVLEEVRTAIYKCLQNIPDVVASEQSDLQAPMAAGNPSEETAGRRVGQRRAVGVVEGPSSRPSPEESDSGSVTSSSSPSSSLHGSSSASSSDGGHETETITRQPEPPRRQDARLAATADTSSRTLSTGQKRRGGPVNALEAIKRPRRADPSPSHRTPGNVVTRTRAADKPCNIPSYPGGHLPAEALKSREAIQQFYDLVAARRGSDNDFRFRSDQDKTERLVDYLSSAGSKSTLAKFMLRFALSQLWVKVDATKQGRLRADTEVCRKIREPMGWDQDQLQGRLSRGRKWNRVCGQYDGLLCFLFLSKDNSFHIHPDTYTTMDDDDLTTFHALLNDDYIKSICEAGKAFQNSLLGADIDFAWETVPSFDSTRLSEAELLSSLQPRLPITENLYRPEEHPSWARPTGWPDDWPWPADPTSEGVSGCDLCNRTSCDCIRQPSKFQPRIKRYGPDRLGLQAVGDAHGTIAYQKSDIIGFLFGEIVPINTAQEDMTLDFVRPDLPEEPVVCQVDCRKSSNCFRLLKRDCEPSARLVPRRVSGRYVAAVIALEKIYDGVEITVSQDHTAGTVRRSQTKEAEESHGRNLGMLLHAIEASNQQAYQIDHPDAATAVAGEYNGLTAFSPQLGASTPAASDVFGDDIDQYLDPSMFD